VQNSFIQYILTYLFWLITCGLALLDALVLRSTYHVLLTFDFSQRYAARAVDDLSVLVLGVLLLILVIFIEHYYRTGAQNNKLLTRFCLLTTIELGMLALLHLVQIGVAWAYGSFNGTLLATAGGEALGALIFGWLYKRFAHQKTASLR
jgi:hypothetical protein